MTDPHAHNEPPTDPNHAGDSNPASDGPFDLATLRQLVRMMDKHGLTEVNLKNGEVQWKLRRGGETAPAPPMGYGYPPPMQASYPSPAPATPAAPSAPATPAAPVGTFIKSPTVGTFYAAPTPEDPPFVTVGKKVEADTVVCLVEAMKVFNQIQAETSGVIAEVLVSTGDSIDFGQPLFRITPA